MANDVDSKSKAAKDEGGILDTIKVVVQALLIALVIRTLLFQPFNIPSGSLIPTLLIGDYLFVSKYTYGYSKHSIPFSPPLFSGRVWAAEPKRGDIAVFKLPTDNFAPASIMDSFFYGALGSLQGNASRIGQTPQVEGPIGFMVD